jgi:hypothetical protein
VSIPDLWARDDHHGLPLSMAECDWCNDMVEVEILLVRRTPSGNGYVRYHHPECSHEWQEFIERDDFRNL